MMRLMVAAYALCAALLMTIGVSGSTPAEAGYYRSAHHRIGHDRGYRGGPYRGYHRGHGAIRTGYYGGRGYYGWRRHYVGHGYGVGCCGGDYRWPYGVGYSAGYGYPGYHHAYDHVGHRYGGYGYYPGYVRGYGCGGGCGAGYVSGYDGCGISIGYGWSGYRASYC